MSARVWVLAGALSCHLACGGPALPPTLPSAHLGKPAPTFRRPLLDGGMFNLADTRGQVTVVKFAANYCVPCKATLPALADVARAHPSVRVIVVAEDEREQDAQTLAQASGAGLPFVHDAGNVLSARYRVADLPTTFVLDKQGNVFWVGGASADEHAIDAAVRNAEAR